MATMTTTKWTIDPTHSEVSFKIKHLMISTVTGFFQKFDGSVETEGDDFNSTSNINFEADIDSINTNNDQRDEHLKSDDFFAKDKHPKITFTADKYEKNSGKITGDLTIRDVTKKVTLDVDFGGTVVDPYGQTKAGITVSGKISRKEFGLTYSAVTETGSLVLGDDVKVNAEVQYVKQA